MRIDSERPTVCRDEDDGGEMKKIMIIILLVSATADLFAQSRWLIRNYNDEFGDPTETEYISHQRVSGVFANVATTGAHLKVEMSVSNQAQNLYRTAGFEDILISFKFYEYAGRHPVKTTSTEDFTVLIKTKSGERIKFSAVQYSTNIYLKPMESKRLSKLLLDGGTIKMNFRDSAMAGLGSSYLFEINGDGYSEVYYKYFKVSKPK